MTPILSVQDLTVEFLRGGEYQPVVRGVSFDVYSGRTLGIVGESGSGKSVSCMSIMGLLPVPPARIASGRALLYNNPENSDYSEHSNPSESSDGVDCPVCQESSAIDLLSLSEAQLRHHRGNNISMIFQEPMTSLNPVHRCGRQVVEMLQLHEEVSDEEARRRVIELFEEVQLPRPEKIFDSYPHEISGGQKQRVMIAMALVCHPRIIIADEPTTALDVMVQKTILDLLRSLQKKYNIGIIFITHDLGVMAQIADDIAVMYHGEIVEQGSASDILFHPRHPYTQGLLACRPPLDARPDHLPTVSDFMLSAPSNPTAQLVPPQPSVAPIDTPLITVRDLHVDFPLKKNIWGKAKQVLHAVDGLSFDIMQGETLGLVGGSGCGKTTLGRTLLRLIESTSGSILYRGTPLDTLDKSHLRHLRTKLQIIFQDPYSSLNPHITVGQAIMEPMQVHGMLGSDAERRDAVIDLMQQVGLLPEHFDRYPHEFSGGQRQRVCIARALILQPELVVCDESVSALDVSVQAQVLNLLNDLKRRHGYTYLFITHDMAVVHFLADRIMVMESGRIVETGTPDEIFDNPQHAYTKKLISSIPRI
ncbi:MAG: ABC transporter ATP-binding protein [Bacteroidales bacterium]|nr:ABC transporter ATP-binding protein [Bacteroidales bacterium]